jgi:F-type H+-transporting ATPase subunit c
MVLFFATALLMAEDGGAAAAGASPFFSPGIAMAVAAGLCGLGQGKAVSAACEGIARNPAAAGNIRTTLIIGLALIESLALYTLIIAFLEL